jgi:hypothetical protein
MSAPHANRLSVAQRILVAMGVKPKIHPFADEMPYVPFVTAVPVELEEPKYDLDEYSSDYHRRRAEGVHYDY